MKNATTTSNRLKGLSALIAALGLILSQQRAQAVADIWTGATTNWNTAGNWSAGVPTSANSPVVIDPTGSHPAVISGGNADSAGDLIVGENQTGVLTIGGSGGTGTNSLTVSNTVTLGLLTGSNGTINVTAGNNGTDTLTAGGTITIGGTTNVPGPGGGSGTINVTGGSAGHTATLTANGALFLDAQGSTQTAALNVTGTRGSVAVNGGDFVVGNTATSTGTNTVTLGTTSLFGGTSGSITVNNGHNFIVGNLGTATNTVTLNSSSSITMTGSGGEFIVGDSATGTNTVNIRSSSTIDSTAASETIIGNNLGSSGTVNVGGGGFLGLGHGTLNTSQLDVGESGTGTLNAFFGSSVSSTGMTIGDAATGVGTVSISTFSTDNVSGALIVGNFGNGTLNVNTLGSVTAHNIDVGNTTTGTGTVTISTGGSMTSTVNTEIGYDGTGTVNVGTGVLDAATMNVGGTLFVGDNSASTTGNGTLKGNGAFSRINVTTGNVHVGDSSNGFSGATGLVTLTNGSILNATTLGRTGLFQAGVSAGSNGTVIVGDQTATSTAIGSNPTNTAMLSADALKVGVLGTGTLIVAGGGPGGFLPATVDVATGNVSIGDQTHYSCWCGWQDGVGTVTVTEGALFNSKSITGTPGTVDIGTAGTGTVYVGLTSTDKATFNADNLIVGDEGDGTLNITGANAVVTVGTTNVAGTGDVTVGNGVNDSGCYTRFGNGSILITEGGTLDDSATGTNSSFVIGNNGEYQCYSSDENVVQVGNNSTDTATLKTDTLVVGATSVGNLFVDGTGSTVTVGTGNVTVGQQSTGNGEFNIYNGAVVDVTTLGGNGLVDLGRDTNSNGEIVLGEDNNFDSAGTGTLKMDSLIVGDSGNGYFDVYNGSTATVSNEAIIGDESGSYGDAYIEGTGSTLTVTTGNLILGNKSGATGYLTVENAAVVNVNGGDIKVGSLSGGYGGFEVTGLGSTVNGSGDLYIDNGYVEEFNNASIDLAGNTHVTVNGTFIGGGGSQITDDYFNAGLLYINNSPSTPDITTFAINGNYVGQGGTIKFDVQLDAGLPTVSDLLTISGNASGNSLVHINNFNGNGGQTTGNGILLIDVDGTNTGTYSLDSRVVAGAYDYNLAQDGQDLFLQSHVSPEVVGAASIAATGQFLEAASLDTLQQRMGQLNQSETPAPAVQTASNDPKDVKDMKEIAAPTVSGPTSEVWSRGIYRYDNLHTGYGLTQDTEVGQIGGDYRFTGLTNLTDALYVGGLADYGQSSGRVTVQPVDLEGEDIGFGAYTTYVNGGFYADGVVKGNFSHYKVKTGFGDYGASGSGVAASLETGYGFNVCDGFMITPQAQVTYQYESYNKPTDSLGRVYDLNDPDYLQTRVGVQFDKSFTYSPGLHFTPYLRTGWLYQALGDNQTTVAGDTFTENTEGSSVEVDGGFTLDVCTNVAIYASGNSAWGDKDDSYGGTGGVKVSW